jgi:hypothetical protein
MNSRTAVAVPTTAGARLAAAAGSISGWLSPPTTPCAPTFSGQEAWTVHQVAPAGQTVSPAALLTLGAAN